MSAVLLRHKLQEEIDLIPEDKLADVYNFIHYFRLGAEKTQPNQNLTATDKAEKYQAIKRVCQEYASLPVLDTRSADEILGYDKSPIGLWGDE